MRWLPPEPYSYGHVTGMGIGAAYTADRFSSQSRLHGSDRMRAARFNQSCRFDEREFDRCPRRNPCSELNRPGHTLEVHLQRLILGVVLPHGEK